MPKMATDNSLNKSSVLKMGQLWHTLADNSTTDEEETEEDEDLNEDNNETMKLKREDMPLFGICPAWDHFYLAVCEYCKQVIKPQALQKHIELRHSYHNHISNTSTINNSLKMRNKSTIRTSITSTTTTTTTTITANGSDIKSNTSNNDSNDKVIDEVNESEVEISVTPIPCVDDSVDNILSEQNITYTKTKSKCLADILESNMSTPLVPEPTGPGPGVGSDNSSESITISVPEINLIKLNESMINIKSETIVSESTIITNKLNAKKKSSYKKPTTPSTRKLLPCKDRLYDPDKHCGVCLPDMDRPCTRSLTCKTHSLTLRRQVQGRIKNFDDLLSEHREAKEAALRAQGIQVKPTKKAIQKQQQQLLKTSQLKTEPNQQLISDHNCQQQTRTQLTTDSDSVQTQPIITTNVCTNINSLLLSSVSSPPSIDNNLNSFKSHNIINQFHSHPNGSCFMSCHPRPAAVCNYNIRNVGQHTRLLSRRTDLTIAALRSTFNNTSLVSKLANNTNNSKCSPTTPLPLHSIKSCSRNTNQSFPPNKKFCTSIETEVESQTEPFTDPYNFADATNTMTNTSNTTFTYNKPKTTISKSTFNTTSKKKKKSDINSTIDHSSLLNNGQLFQLSSTHKTIGNSQKKFSNKKTINNSHTTSISATIPISNNINNSNNNNTLSNNTSNSIISNCEQLYYPSTSLVSEVPSHRNLNEMLSNSIDSYKSDNGSILLNGSLLSCKNNSTFTKQTNNNNNTKPITDSININTIFPAKNYSNKLALNKISSPPLSSISTSISVSPNLRPISQKQSLPSTPVNTSLSQNISQLSHNIHNTTHTIFIKSPKQSLQHQLTANIPSAKILSKSDNYMT